MADREQWTTEEAEPGWAGPRPPREDYRSELEARAAYDWLKPRLDGVLLGPAGAGKTALIGALRPACEAATEALELRLVPGVALASPIGASPRTEPTTYDFQLGLRGSTFAPSSDDPREFSMLLRDLPGRTFFDSSIDWGRPDPGTAEALAETASAAWWILLVDSVAPRPELWQFRLPQLVAHSVHQDPSRTVPFAGVSLRHASQEPALALKRRIVQQRVLVLLNKVDLLVEEAKAELRRTPRGSIDPRLQGLAQLEAPELARRLDPVRTAQELLGGGLGQLRAGLSDGAQLAVGWLSATGFRRTRPHDALGTALFGVREALIFLTTGRCLSPIHPVNSLTDLNPAPWSRRS